LHYVAFAAPFVQRMLVQLENDLFARRIAEVRSTDEVFIAGLPRAGTTLLLDLLYNTGEFASFTYRDMPFVLSPLLWSRVTRAFAREARAGLRAHDDGMLVSFDSPEAFEEVIWLTYLRDRIVRDRSLDPVTADRLSRELVDGMRAAIRSLLAHRGADGATRYLSKNNANVSRIDALAAMFPRAIVLVAFRHPASQVASLERQHRRFSELHGQDRFARNYMKWIGHYEFGANLRPINYRGWLDESASFCTPETEFWLRYWTETYRHALLHRRDNVLFVDFDALLENGEAGLAAIAEAVRLRVPSALTGQAKTLRAPGSRPVDTGQFAKASWEEASGIYRRLREAALQPLRRRAEARESIAANSSRFC
jgi:hypothetical protein